MRNIEKKLTKRPYTLVIYAAGIGSKYHTLHQIRKNMPGEYKWSSDVYRMIKELVPSKYVEHELLLNLNDLHSAGTNDGRYKRKLIRKINRIFHLKWEMGSKDDEIEDDNARVRFKIGDDCRSITLYHDSSNALFIELDEQIKQYCYGHLTIFSGGKIVSELELLILKRNQKTGKRALYITKCLEKRPRYLDVELNDRAKKTLLEINDQALTEDMSECNEDYVRALPEILEIKNNRDNWLYRSNFRGFLLFLASESRLEDEKKSCREIRDLLSKASNEWIAKEASFLDYWQDFVKVGFDVVEILRNIGSEINNQVTDENINNDHLLTIVTERYYDAVSFYFDWFNRSLFLARNKKYIEEYGKCNIHDKLRSYHLKTLKRLRMGFVKKVETIDKILESD